MYVYVYVCICMYVFRISQEMKSRSQAEVIGGYRSYTSITDTCTLEGMS